MNEQEYEDWVAKVAKSINYYWIFGGSCGPGCNLKLDCGTGGRDPNEFFVSVGHEGSNARFMVRRSDVRALENASFSRPQAIAFNAMRASAFVHHEHFVIGQFLASTNGVPDDTRILG